MGSSNMYPTYTTPEQNQSLCSTFKHNTGHNTEFPLLDTCLFVPFLNTVSENVASITISMLQYTLIFASTATMYIRIDTGDSVYTEYYDFSSDNSFVHNDDGTYTSYIDAVFTNNSKYNISITFGSTVCIYSNLPTTNDDNIHIVPIDDPVYDDDDDTNYVYVTLSHISSLVSNGSTITYVKSKYHGRAVIDGSVLDTDSLLFDMSLTENIQISVEIVNIVEEFPYFEYDDIMNNYTKFIYCSDLEFHMYLNGSLVVPEKHYRSVYISESGIVGIMANKIDNNVQGLYDTKFIRISTNGGNMMREINIDAFSDNDVVSLGTILNGNPSNTEGDYGRFTQITLLEPYYVYCGSDITYNEYKNTIPTNYDENSIDDKNISIQAVFPKQNNYDRYIATYNNLVVERYKFNEL